MSTGSLLSIRVLRDRLNRCLDECEEQLGADVDLDADHYWLVETSHAFDLSEQPALNAGRLSDDLEELARPLDPHEPYLIWHELGHLIGPLSRLASITLDRNN